MNFFDYTMFKKAKYYVPESKISSLEHNCGIILVKKENEDYYECVDVRFNIYTILMNFYTLDYNFTLSKKGEFYQIIIL